MNLKRLLASTIALAVVAAAACAGSATGDTPAPATDAAVASQPTATAPAALPTVTTTPTPVRAQLTLPAPTATPVPAPITISPDAEQVLAAQEEAFGQIYRATLPSVVDIKVAQSSGGDFGQFGFGQGGLQPTGEGSGFVWDSQGHIVTNNHVVAGADVVTVAFADGTEVVGQVIGTDPNSDLAVVKVDLPSSRLVPISLGDSSQATVGQLAIAIGNPFARDFTMTTGIVSAVGRDIQSLTVYKIPLAIQTDAAINPGNSGGPLLDRHGRVIGINAQIETNSGSSSGVGFAIPINIAKLVVPGLIENGTYTYAYLGVGLSDVTQEVASEMSLPPETRGALLEKVDPGTPAERAGLRGYTRQATSALGEPLYLGGDVVIRMNDTQIASAGDLIAFTALNSRPGDVVHVTVIRGGKQMTLDVTMGTRPDN